MWLCSLRAWLLQADGSCPRGSEMERVLTGGLIREGTYPAGRGAAEPKGDSGGSPGQGSGKLARWVKLGENSRGGAEVG